MAITTRTIQSPGVEIREFDLSQRLPTPPATSVYITGFAPEGPTDQVVGINSLGEFEAIYGKPTNAAERYFYHTVRATFLGSQARVNVNRLPYGQGTGVGFGSYYTALVFPALFHNAGNGSMSTNLNGVSGTYFLGKPKLFSLTQSEYENLAIGNVNWSTNAASLSDMTTTSKFGSAGLIIVNKGQTTIDQTFRGYYLSFVDNVDADNIGSSFNKVQTALTVSTTAAATGLTNFTTIPNSVLTFSLTAAVGTGATSLSYLLESASKGYIIGNDVQYDDVLNLAVVKLTNSVFQDDPNKLIFNAEELYTGSFTNPFRQFAPTNGGQPVTYSLQNIIADRSANISMFVNPYITNQALDSAGKGSSYDSQNSTKTLKKVRTINHNMVDNYASLSAYVGTGAWTVGQTALDGAVNALGFVDSLLPLGSYNPAGPDSTKIIGNLPAKLSRSLDKIKDDELYDIDLLVEGGLGTVYAYTYTTGQSSYDDTLYNATFQTELDALRVTQPANSDISDAYTAVVNEFLNVATTYQQGGRGDTFFIADPVRQIFIKGANTKYQDTNGYVFSRDTYWALRNLYSAFDTSYAGTYANWMAVIDPVTNVKTWVPPSGFVASRMVATDSLIGPWIAPAGFTRGIVQGAIDIAWSPNQRQRDELYKVRLNPIASFPGQGIVVYGQKTLQTKPSAFDRINVRRGFLYYEKAVKSTMKFFVFEPNTSFLRGRVLATLNPFFERIKAAEGVYDFLVVCDDRNNTSETIDNNELIVDIYLKPVRAAEFILVNFYATRTSANFEELVARA